MSRIIQKTKTTIQDLPITLNLAENRQENWFLVLGQILAEQSAFKNTPTETDDDFIDLKKLLKTESKVEKLIQKELQSEKSSHIS